MPECEQEQFTYQVGKITFIVTPVYQTEEPLKEILLKLMRADIEQA